MDTDHSKMKGNERHSLSVLNPVAVREFKPMLPAKRLKDLKNRKIGLYWNYKARGDIALSRVKELLSERFEPARNTRKKFFLTPLILGLVSRE